MSMNKPGLLISFLLIIALCVNGQNIKYGEMDFVTIVKQSGDVTNISIIAPVEFDGVNCRYSMKDTSGVTIFKSSGKKATTSFNIKPLYLDIKGKPLHLDFDSDTPDLVIPTVYVDGTVRTVGDGEIITHTSSMSKMGVWNCKSSIRKEPYQPLRSLPQEIRGQGEVYIIPIPENNNSAKPEVIAYYETFLPGEALVKMVSSLHKQSSGSQGKVLLANDFHGRAAQMSHVMQKQGLEGLIQRNMKPGFYRWYAADLSSIYVWAPHICSKIDAANISMMRGHVVNEIVRYDSLYNHQLSVYPVAMLSDDSMLDYDDFVNYWYSLRYYINDDGETKPMHLPKIRVVDYEKAFEVMKNSIDTPVSLMGEYHCTDPILKKPEFYNALKSAVASTNTLLTAEKMATFLSLLKDDFFSYPQLSFDNAWDMILTGKGEDKEVSPYLLASNIGDSILNNTMTQISQLISTQGYGRPVVVVNPGTHSVSDVIAFPVNITLHDTKASPGRMQPENTLNWRVFDGEGKETEAQLITRGRGQHIVFAANDVPGSGFKTYYIKASGNENQSSMPSEIEQKENSVFIENRYYRISLTGEGIDVLYDKKLKRNLLHPDYALGSILMKSTENGEVIYRSSAENATWKMNFNGPVLSEFMKVEKTPAGDINSTITIYHQIKKIAIDIKTSAERKECDCIIENPLVADMLSPTIEFKVPFGFSKVGSYDVEDEVSLYPKDKNLSSIRNVNGLVTIKDGDAELCISGDFVVTDIKATDESEKYICVAPWAVPGNGNEVISHFEVSSSFAGDKQLLINAYTTKQPLMAVSAPEKNMGMIPDQLSFFKLRNREIEISSLRKSEDNNDVVIRFLETAGKKTFAILDPMFSFSGFSKADLNGKVLEPIPVAPATRLKLKTAIEPWSVSTIILHR